MTPPVLKAGWQTDQSANSKDLTFNYRPGSYQSNPRLGGSVAFPAATPNFNKIPGTINMGTAASAPLVSTYYGGPGVLFASIAGSSTAASGSAPSTPATAATAAGIVGAPTSKLPCYPTDKY